MSDKTDSERIAVIESIVMRMEKRLFGQDGDQGEIENLKARVTKLENWKVWIVGVAIGLGTACGALGHKMLEKYLLP